MGVLCCCVSCMMRTGLQQDASISFDLQAATVPPHQATAADPPAFIRMQMEQYVNASEVDGLTPFHLAMINGISPQLLCAM